MKDAGTRTVLLACAGLIAASACWAVSTQLGLILPYAECGSHFRPLLIVTALLTLATLGTSVVSWRAPWPGRIGQFTAQLSALFAVVLAFAMVLQVLAASMLTGCER